MGNADSRATLMACMRICSKINLQGAMLCNRSCWIASFIVGIAYIKRMGGLLDSTPVWRYISRDKARVGRLQTEEDLDVEGNGKVRGIGKGGVTSFAIANEATGRLCCCTTLYAECVHISSFQIATSGAYIFWDTMSRDARCTVICTRKGSLYEDGGTARILIGRAFATNRWRDPKHGHGEKAGRMNSSTAVKISPSGGGSGAETGRVTDRHRILRF